MEQTAVEWLEQEILSRITKRNPHDTITIQTQGETLTELVEQAKEMEKDRESRIKELETFLQEYILDDVYYYHSPIWYRATELLNQNKDEDEL